MTISTFGYNNYNSAQQTRLTMEEQAIRCATHIENMVRIIEAKIPKIRDKKDVIKKLQEKIIKKINIDKEDVDLSLMKELDEAINDLLLCI